MAKINPRQEALIQLFKESQKSEIVVSERTTSKSRKAKMLQDLQETNIPRLTEIKDTLAGFMQLVLQPLGDEAVLTEPGAEHLMRVALADRTVEEIATVVRAEVKRVVFEHLDAAFAADGEKDPQSVNGSIQVPTLGYELRREGAGYADPTIDEEILAEILGDRVQEVYDERTVTVRELNVDLLLEMAKADPALLHKITPALVPGALKKGRLNLRNMNPEEDPIDG